MKEIHGTIIFKISTRFNNIRSIASFSYVRDKGHDVHTDPLTPMDLTAYPIGMALPSRKDLQQIDIGDDMPIVNDADPKIWETVKERRAKRKEVHQLGEGGGSKNTKEQQQWNKIQAAKTLSINAAVAAASQSVENSVNNKNSDGIEKWLFESQASDTNDHVPLRNEPDEEVYATQNTLLKDKVG